MDVFRNSACKALNYILLQRGVINTPHDPNNEGDIGTGYEYKDSIIPDVKESQLNRIYFKRKDGTFVGEILIPDEEYKNMVDIIDKMQSDKNFS